MTHEFPFQAVIFDMDGVLVDTEMHYWRELKAFSDAKNLGVTKRELDEQVGQSHPVFQRLLATWLTRSGYGELEPEEAERVFNEWAADYPCDYKALLNPGAAETVRGLRALGVRVALASSSKMDNIQTVLAACGLSQAFETIVSGEQFHESKPNPEIYLHTLDVLGLPARACCCVEDSVPGIAAGKRAGLTVIAKREERFGYSQAEADLIIDALPDLLRVSA